MGEHRSDDQATVDVALSEKLAERRDRFAEAWRISLDTGSAPPRLDDYLAGIHSAELPMLRLALERIENEYRLGGTIHHLPAPTQDPSAGTVDAPPPNASTTADVARASAPAKPPSAGSDGTVDVDGKSSGSTVDQPAAPAPAADDGGTVDFSANAHGAVESLGFDAVSKASGKMQELPTIAGYQILGVLGRGAMGVVYKARQRGLRREVALKMILSGGHASDSDIARFRSEAEAVGQLQHPNIVQVFEVGEQDGCPYFSLEYVEGGSLSKKINGEPQPVRPAAHLTMLMAQGMEAAHQKGIVHRDLKPGNVMLTRPRLPGAADSGSTVVSISEALYGTPKIADFGLAKKLEEESGNTRSGTVLGTPSYMAPEQADGRSRDVGPLADVYALGAVLYELLTGRPPFRGESMWDTLDQVRTREPVPPTQLQPRVPRDLETICLKCLQKSPVNRYASASAMAEDLRRFLNNEPIVARPVSAPERTWRWCKRNPVVASLTALTFASLVLGIIFSLFYAHQANENADLAMAKKREADAAKELAKKNADQAIAEKAIAEKERDKAKIARDFAQKQSENAEASFKEMFNFVNEKFKDVSGSSVETMSAELRKIRKQLAQIGASAIEKSAELAKSNPELGGKEPGLAKRALALQFKEAAWTYQREMNDGQKALENYRKAFDILSDLVKEYPDADLYRGTLGTAYGWLGDMHLHLGEGAKLARDKYHKGREVWQGVIDHPRDRYYLASDARKKEQRDGYFAIERLIARTAVRLGDPADAKKAYTPILEYYEQLAQNGPPSDLLQQARAQMYQTFADLSWRLGDDKAFVDYQNRCLQIREAFLAKKLSDNKLRFALATSYGPFAEGHLRQNRLEVALELYNKALAELAALRAADPTKSDYQYLTAMEIYGKATVLLLLDRQAEAKPLFEESLKRHLELAKADPKDSPGRVEVMMALARCGDLAKAITIAGDLRQHSADNAEKLRQIACCYAVCASTIGPAEKAYESLIRSAIDCLNAGTLEEFRDFRDIETDPELTILHGQPAFRDLVARIRRQAEGK
jgi:eukaryotic-like serine/threonine-protein kinase